MRFFLLVTIAAVACSSGPPVIDSFAVDEANPDVGAPVTFSFAVRGASTVRIEPAPGVVHGSPVTVVIDEKSPSCGMTLHVRDLPLYDYREALRPPTRFLPLEEEEYEEEG